MFRINKINSNIIGLIGWRQPVNPTYAIVNETNQASSSEAYFQDFSALVTIENIKECQNYVSISDAQFNTLLSDLTKSAMVKVLNQVFQDDDFLENKILYPFESSWNYDIVNDTSFVGFELEQPTRRELIHVINKVILSFDSVNNVKLLVFHSSEQNPIYTKTIATKANSDVEEIVDWNFTKEYNGGKFYIGYLRSGLTAKAKNRDWDKANVKSCFNTLRIEPIIVSGWNAETLFDVENIEYDDKTFGLNFDISAWKDYTNMIIQNKRKFVNALGLQVAIDVADLILKSTNSDRVQRISDTKVMLELEGVINNEIPRVIGLRGKLQSEVKKLKKNFIELPTIQRSTL